MKIIKLTVSNIMRVSSVEIEPSGSVVVIGGNNGQGKSSVLSAIEMALGGKGKVVKKPIREGEEKASVLIDLGDIHIERIFTANGSRLVVKAASGAVFPSPQEMLNKLVGKLAFDPLEFARADSVRQAMTLKILAGLDLSDLDEKRSQVYSQRTEVNRDVDRLKGVVASLKPIEEEVPEEVPDVSKLLEEIEKIEDRNSERAQKIEAVEWYQEQYTNTVKNIDENDAKILVLKDQIKDLEEINSILKKETVDITQKGKKATEEKKKAVAEIEDVEPIRKQIRDSQKIAELVSRKKVIDSTNREFLDVKKKSKEFTDQIAKIDVEKEKRIAGAKFPIDGLRVDDNGVSYNGIPFSQASSAEQLRTSVAIGLALNPKLKVMIVRDGSLLDEDGMKLLSEAADKAGAQIWCEVVGKRDDVSFLIEDGHLA